MIRNALDQGEGVLRLAPTWVPRSFCIPGKRLKLHASDLYAYGAVRGVMDDPLFEGYTCIKGRQLPDQMADPDRLRAPLRRRPDGTFEQATSREVLDEIGDELRRIIDTYGPRAVASYTGTGGYQNSVAVPAARAFHQGLGSVSFYTSVTIDQPAKGLAAFRLGGWEAGYHNFTDSDVHMAIGYNPMVSSYGPRRYLCVQGSTAPVSDP